MDLNKIAERASQKETRFDKHGKEVYIGDIVEIPSSNSSLVTCIISGFTPKAIKMINISTKNSFLYFGEFIKINFLFDVIEMKQFDEIRNNVLNKIEEKKKQYITTKYIALIIHYKDNNLYQLKFQKVRSQPGKNIVKADIIKSYEELKSRYNNVDFYPIKKEYTVGYCNEIPNFIFCPTSSLNINMWNLETNINIINGSFPMSLISASGRNYPFTDIFRKNNWYITYEYNACIYPFPTLSWRFNLQNIKDKNCFDFITNIINFIVEKNK